MAKRLSTKDIDQLLVQYRGERRRLLFQLDGVRKALRELKGMSAAAAKAERSSGSPNTLPKRRPGRPKAAAKAAKKVKRGPGRPSKRKREGGPKINAWDQVIINTITSAKRLLPKEDLKHAAMTYAAKAHKGMKEDEVEAYVTRALQKLTSRVKKLGMHHTGLRRGNHYGLGEWFFASSGKLRRTHYDKLVLTEREK
ncbi:MAG: hypothetical protein JNM31_10925 [Flavobacteriales bacterium]|nr:hypothetical protein [Flavobacteriales bacterium]